MDCSLPGSSVHGILQVKVLEWVALPSSRGISWPKDQTHISCITGRFFTAEPPRKPSPKPTYKVILPLVWAASRQLFLVEKVTWDCTGWNNEEEKEDSVGRKDEERAGGVEVTKERKRETHTPENENFTPASPCFPAKPVKNPGLSLKLTSNNFQQNQYWLKPSWEESGGTAGLSVYCLLQSRETEKHREFSTRRVNGIGDRSPTPTWGGYGGWRSEIWGWVPETLIISPECPPFLNLIICCPESLTYCCLHPRQMAGVFTPDIISHATQRGWRETVPTFPQSRHLSLKGDVGLDWELLILDHPAGNSLPYSMDSAFQVCSREKVHLDF